MLVFGFSSNVSCYLFLSPTFWSTSKSQRLWLRCFSTSVEPTVQEYLKRLLVQELCSRRISLSVFESFGTDFGPKFVDALMIPMFGPDKGDPFLDRNLKSENKKARQSGHMSVFFWMPVVDFSRFPAFFFLEVFQISSFRSSTAMHTRMRGACILGSRG